MHAVQYALVLVVAAVAVLFVVGNLGDIGTDLFTQASDALAAVSK